MKSKQSLSTFALTYIANAITNFLDFTNRKELMTAKQVAETATLIFEEPIFERLKLDDFALFVRKCKLGEFGDMYTINGTLIIQWLRKYTIERNNYLFKLKEKQDQEEKEKDDYDYNSPIVEQARERCCAKIAALAKRMDAARTHTTTTTSPQEQADRIRRRIIKENQSLYHTDPKNACDIIDNLINEALLKEHITV